MRVVVMAFLAFRSNLSPGQYYFPHVGSLKEKQQMNYSAQDLAAHGLHLLAMPLSTQMTDA